MVSWFPLPLISSTTEHSKHSFSDGLDPTFLSVILVNNATAQWLTDAFVYQSEVDTVVSSARRVYLTIHSSSPSSSSWIQDTLLLVPVRVTSETRVTVACSRS